MLHIFSMKNKTKQLAIKPISDASVFHIPLLQHLGKPAEPIVQPGDYVKQYQLIGKAVEGLSANIHSPVSGKVLELKEVSLADGSKVPAVLIENDYKYNEYPYQKSNRPLTEILKDAGIVGEGGAQFPTHLKYAIGDKKIKTLIINGTECEPYLTADYALMSQHTEELLKGILIVGKALNVEEIVITIEEQNRELSGNFASFLVQNNYKKIRIRILPNTYPQGGELQLIKSVTGIELPRTKLPKDAGIIVSNVGTVYAVYQAVEKCKPIISRFITVSGEKSKNWGNYEVKIGTPIAHILKELEISSDDKNIVLGGPMMGKDITDLNVPITKGSSGVLFLKKKSEERNNCISCGYCVEVCPMHLMPMKFEEIFRQRKFFKLEKFHLSNCIECAACEYICPSNVPLIKSIKEGKTKLKELANAIQ